MVLLLHSKKHTNIERDDTVIRWLLLFPAALVITILSYPCNPIVALFADDDSELHGALEYFQTWDNSLTPSDIVDIFPGWLTDFWNKHYEELEIPLPEYNRTRWITPCIDKEFGFIDSLKRYACRTMWLMRNSGYTFMFRSPFGVMSPSANLITDGHWTYDKTRGKLFGVFAYTNSDEVFSIGRLHISFNIYIGWKLTKEKDCQCMYALRPLAFKVEWEK